MKILKRALCIAVLLMPATAANAQIPWETPQLIAPHAPRGVSLMGASYAAAPGDGWGVIVAFRRADAPTGLGFRIAGGEGAGGSRAIGVGIEASAWITEASDAFPVDVIWTSGIGGSYGSSMQIALPIGIAASRSFGQESVWFNPYAASRVIIEGRLGGRAPEDELDFQLATEIGANLAFDRDRKFIVRMAAAIGDRSGLALGAHLGGGRREMVRAAAATVRHP